MCAPFKLLLVVAFFVFVNIPKAYESCSPAGHFGYDVNTGNHLDLMAAAWVVGAPGFIPTPGDVLEFELEKGKLESPVRCSTSERDIRK